MGEQSGERKIILKQAEFLISVELSCWVVNLEAAMVLRILRNKRNEISREGYHLIGGSTDT